jgi:hypothetical protein
MRFSGVVAVAVLNFRFVLVHFTSRTMGQCLPVHSAFAFAYPTVVPAGVSLTSFHDKHARLRPQKRQEVEEITGLDSPPQESVDVTDAEAALEDDDPADAPASEPAAEPAAESAPSSPSGGFGKGGKGGGLGGKGFGGGGKPPGGGGKPPGRGGGNNHGDKNHGNKPKNKDHKGKGKKDKNHGKKEHKDKGKKDKKKSNKSKNPLANILVDDADMETGEDLE